MTDTATNPLASVAFRYSGLYRDLFFALARLLKDRHGSRLHMYYPRPEMGEMLRNAVPSDLFDSLTFIEPAHPRSFPTHLDRSAVEQQAQAYEQRYDRTYTWFAVPDRHFGRGYAPAGFYHPRSIQSEGSDYVTFLDAYSKYFDFWEQQFSENGITLMINGDWRESAVARAHGAALRTPSSARHLNFHYWATDEFGNTADMPAAYAAQPLPSAPREINEGPFVQMALGRTMRGRAKLSSLLQRMGRKLYTYSRWRLSGHSKGHLYLVTDELKYFVREWREARRMQGRKMARLSELVGTPYVYFPLQVDPETGFQGRSPEYFNQHAAIVSISRDLPAGVRLAIKEHFPALGLRPVNFYDQLRDLKNVVLLDVRENGLDAIRHCSAVATINGSSGQEAAVLGKPVITFGRHNLYNVLEHVFVVSDETQLAGTIRTALAEGFDHESAALDGARFLAALEELSFDLERFSHFAKSDFSASALEEAYKTLVDSFGIGPSETPIDAASTSVPQRQSRSA